MQGRTRKKKGKRIALPRKAINGYTAGYPNL